MHLSSGNNHINRINKDNKGRNSIKTRMFVNQLYQICAGKKCRNDANNIGRNNAHIQRKSMSRTSGKTGFDKQEKIGPRKTRLSIIPNPIADKKSSIIIDKIVVDCF